MVTEWIANDRFCHQGIHFASLRRINGLPDTLKTAIYETLIPSQLLANHDAIQSWPGRTAFQVHAPKDTGFAKIEALHSIDDRDPVLYVEMTDTSHGQIEILLLVVNDLTAPRFNVDRDWQGEYTKLGTLDRNLNAELAAMRAGLAPGQVRQGLRLTRQLIPLMEQFIRRMGKDRVFIEPLAYHAAILFERYGFSYLTGKAKMETIDAEFQPGGPLEQKLDGATPFRQPTFAQTIRGRSWAIHDGILDEPWEGIKMYKRIGHHAQICTAPDAAW